MIFKQKFTIAQRRQSPTINSQSHSNYSKLKNKTYSNCIQIFNLTQTISRRRAFQLPSTEDRLSVCSKHFMPAGTIYGNADISSSKEIVL